MNKLIVAITCVALAVIGGYFLFPQESVVPVVSSVNQDQTYPEYDLVDDPFGKKEGTNGFVFNPDSLQKMGKVEPGISDSELAKFKESANSARDELNEMIVRLDDNRSDPETRKEMKHQMGEKMTEYNESILPVVMSEMKDANPAGQK